MSAPFTVAPRCGHPVRAYRTYVPGETRPCGRPAGHPGPHRSAPSVQAAYRNATTYQQARRQQA